MIIPNVWTNKKWSKPPTIYIYIYIYIYVDFHGYQGPILVSMWRTNQGHKLQWTRKHTQKKTLVIKPDFGQVSLIYFSDSAIKTQLNILEPLNLETKMIFIDVFPIKTSIYRWFCHYNLLLLINRRKNNIVDFHNLPFESNSWYFATPSDPPQKKHRFHMRPLDRSPEHLWSLWVHQLVPGAASIRRGVRLCGTGSWREIYNTWWCLISWIFISYLFNIIIYVFHGI